MFTCKWELILYIIFCAKIDIALYLILKCIRIASNGNFKKYYQQTCFSPTHSIYIKMNQIQLLVDSLREARLIFENLHRT
jgi:hypothetical protein